MDKDIFEAFSEYNKRANANMNSIIKKLSEEEWDKPFPTYWKSIHGLCSHIFLSDYNWLRRFCDFCGFTELKQLFNDNNILNDNWGETMFKNMNEYIKMREELDEKINIFINMIKDEQLLILMPLEYKGNVNTEQLGIYLTHVFNHATHCRGQISVYLEMLGKENDYGSFKIRD
jgi:uncharacterized damage-inducible protein DinB